MFDYNVCKQEISMEVLNLQLGRFNKYFINCTQFYCDSVNSIYIDTMCICYNGELGYNLFDYNQGTIKLNYWKCIH